VACYNPIAVSLSPRGTDGKKTIVWAPSKEGFQSINLPCGQCVGCRISKAQSWATRCLAEASLHSENSFITLTYDDDHLKSSSLVKEDFQKFFKRLRRYYPEKEIRYYACGEYGDLTERPHFHACVFGLDFEDKIPYKKDDKNPLWTSEILNERWGKGFCIIGQVNFETAAYVARYIGKKILGTNKYAEDLRAVVYKGREPEFALMSRRPGIAKKWFELYSNDVYPSDEIIQNGVPLAVPRYYDILLEKSDFELFEKIKKERLERPKADRYCYDRIQLGKKSVDYLKNKEKSITDKIKARKRDQI